MKTKRLKMVHSLINQYDLTSKLNMFLSKEASNKEIASFHDPKYVEYLEAWVCPKKDEPRLDFKE